ncbi:PRC-barrel domain-containing protein [Castellaniella hirudinis]|uniref:PRC-barrel domain-containing protein n=1 Tax=Castellaniella hirudinis TaxID=1144617 RepID=UPI0039C3A00E
MQTRNSLTALALASMMLCSTAYAQAPAKTDAAMPPAGGQTTTNQQESSQVLASNLIGMTVLNGTGDDAESIGKVTDLVLDRNQTTVNVLIGVGGFLGIGAKDVGVPLNKVEFNPETRIAVVSLTKEQLEQAPAYVTLREREAQSKQAVQQAQMAQPASPLQAPAAPAQ